MTATEASAPPLFAGPEGFVPEDEYQLHTVPPVPGASENFWWTAYDPDQRIGFWTHLGRTSWDPYLWREIVVVYLPSGDFLLSKSFGRHEHRLGPGASTLRMSFTEPWNRGVVTMDGAAVQASPEQVHAGLCGEGAHVPLQFELRWTSFGRPWSLHRHELSGQSWGDSHYEQLFTAEGSVSYGEHPVPIQATGMRDHSRGTRDLLGMPRHTAYNCVFPHSGRGFFAVELPLDGGGIARGAIVEGDQLINVDVTRNTGMLTSVDGAERKLAFDLRWSGGSATVSAEIVQNMPMGFAGLSEFVLGRNHRVAYTALNEGFARFTWDGETSHGLVERSFRHRTTR
jgi:hypothetical protein